MVSPQRAPSRQTSATSTTTDEPASVGLQPQQQSPQHASQPPDESNSPLRQHSPSQPPRRLSSCNLIVFDHPNLFLFLHFFSTFDN
eukprot:m.335817 g.335817  ORF g.335817 m.335817 type:complete len:86 (-) comp55685_c0_seq4:440-697(-)